MRVSRIGLVVLMFAATFARAGTFAVGGCRPNLPNYPTISAAVADPATAGSTIFVCAGTYNEQVLITQPLTLQGIAVGENSAAVVMPPSGTMQSLSTSDGLLSYQIAVVNPGGPVNLKDLAVDGNGAVVQPNSFLDGIYYYDASGSITSVVARNQINSGAGIGILTYLDELSGPQTLTITNSVVANFDDIGIGKTFGAQSLDLTMKSNSINSNGTNAYGVYLDESVTGTVASNIINAPGGLYIFGSSVTASNNTIRGEVILNTGSNTLTSNHINASTALDGVGILLNGPGTNLVELNNIVNATTAIGSCLGLGDLPTGNMVMHNTIINSTVGINVPYGNTIVPNYFELVPTAVQPCP